MIPLVSVVLVTLIFSRPDIPAMSLSDWQTEFERSGFVRTGRYQEILDFCNRLAKSSPWVKKATFGTSPEGRPMIALVLSRERDLSPKSSRKSAKPLVMVNNGIHAGEIEGKDACLMLAREIAITKREKGLLDNVNLLIVPVFNVDGHERFGRYHRINQNGPEEMGFRSTASNLNLNRDWTKADAPEMRAMLSLIHKWKPDFFFDIHTTDGADWQYAAQITVPVAPNLDARVAEWSRRFVEQAQPKIEKDGFLLAPYFGSVSAAQPERGVTVEEFSPRYSTGYWPAINRPNMLVETHMLKPYKFRVETTLSILRRGIEEIARSRNELRSAIASADKADRKLESGTAVTLGVRLTPKKKPFTFRGWKYAPYKSEITGGMIPAWEHKPVDTQTTIRSEFEPAFSALAPAAYSIPPGWTEILDRLKLHGFQFTRLKKKLADQGEVVRFQSLSFVRQPFEGRFAPSYEVVRQIEPIELPAGTVIVPANQPGARLLMHLLEPEDPDSFLKWGLFNTIFETKEYFESYAMEPIAQKMLREQPGLKAEFENALKTPAFEGNPRARLEFFFKRSPYADERLNRYPVIKLGSLPAEGASPRG